MEIQHGGHNALSVFIVIFPAIESSLMQGHSHIFTLMSQTVIIVTSLFQLTDSKATVNRFPPGRRVRLMEGSRVHFRCVHLPHSDESTHVAPVYSNDVCAWRLRRVLHRKDLSMALQSALAWEMWRTQGNLQVEM